MLAIYDIPDKLLPQTVHERVQRGLSVNTAPPVHNSRTILHVRPPTHCNMASETMVVDGQLGTFLIPLVWGSKRPGHPRNKSPAPSWRRLHEVR